MLCPLCHTPNRDNARFCKTCGRLLATEVVATALVAEGEPSIAVEPAQGTPLSETQQPPTGDVAIASEPLPEKETANQLAELDNTSDIAISATQIISPQQMHALHVRKWQQDLEREQQSGADIADLPTIHFSPIAEAEQEDLSEQPTIIAPPVSTEVPAETVQESQGIATTEESAADVLVASPTAEEELSLPAAQNLPVSDRAPAALEQEPVQLEEEVSVENGSEQADEQSKQAFPVLAVGTVIGDRYAITQVLNEGEDENLYEVADQKGYLHCWNCGSEENAEGDEFCNDCGAELQSGLYNMHSYPPEAKSQDDAHVLQGTIVNTFVDQGMTYVIEQPQTMQSSFPNGVRLLAASDSDAGDLRRADPNEDSTALLLFERIHESASTPAGIFVIADGMGGHANGQGASRLTTAVIAERIVRELLMPPLSTEKVGEEVKAPDEEAILALVHGAVEDANTALCQLNQREKSDMGSTLTGFLIIGDHAYIFNVGDSRTYMLRNQQLYQLTNDHSLVGQLVAGGLITPDDVYTHPQRSQIYRSIGDKLNVQIDLFKQQVHPGDVLLSCSDGLWEMVRNPQITEILNKAQDPQTACTQLIEAANTNGGEDNVSAVVVFVR